MKGSKILAMLVVLAMLLSTMVVLNQLGINVVEKAGAANVIGVNVFQGSVTPGAKILNMTATELSTIKVGNTVTLKFNGTLITAGCQLYYPAYNTVYDAGSGKWEVWTNWSAISGVSLGASTVTPTALNVALNCAGLWLVVPSNSPALWKLNMSNMSVNTGGVWSSITGWFWVNSSSWTVSLSKDTIYYDRNDSLDITVKDAAGNAVTSSGFIDIWNIADKKYSLAYHKNMPAAGSGMVWTINGQDMYTYTHSKGAGIYAITAYEDTSPAHGTPTTAGATTIYGDTGDSSFNGARGYNNTFGNTTIWSARFLVATAGPTTQIRGWDGNPVTTTTWAGTTYKYNKCGPFDPPEYWSGYTNFTVAAGVPVATVTNGTPYWNDTADNEVKITVHNYAGQNITFAIADIKLFNKSNNPASKNSIPISSLDYNVICGGGYIRITPKGPWNRWGYNITSNKIWAPKNKVYVTYAKSTVGNDSEEWNGTSYFTLISAQARFVWVSDDGGTGFDNKPTDGVLQKIPDASKVPLSIVFKVQGDDYSYWGTKGVTKAAENITISGNSLFTGTLDKFPGFTTGWFDGTSKWTVPIIPTMSQGGGKITITIHAWNKTLYGYLAIGGGTYLTNGSIVTVTPNEFNIGAKDQTLTVTVKRADGVTNNPFGTVYLYYLKNDGKLATSCTTYVTTTTDTYSIKFNKTQQTKNQTSQLIFGTIAAPRNLTIYVEAANSGYGYALVQMKPESNLKVMTSKSTILAGYNYDDFYINTTVVDTKGNSTGTPSIDDKANFTIKIYDKDKKDVTDALLSPASPGVYDYDSTDLIGSSTYFSKYSFHLTDLYITKPGTYTIHAYNNTHNSDGYDAILVVDQVLVTCDKSPLIWKADNNISATFTATYNGQESLVAGTLLVDNMTDLGDYKQTWVNSSFDGTNYLGSVSGNNDSLILDEDAGFVNGTVTAKNITANYLPTNKAEKIITFWFKPDNGHWAQAKGVLPVSVPSVSTDKQQVSLGKSTNVVATVTGRGAVLEDVFVGLHGCGIATTNGTTGSDGKVAFSIYPTSQGKIKLDVGEEGRTTDTEIQVTNWQLKISVDKTQVNEGTDFTVTVIREDTNAPVSDVWVTFSAIVGGKATDATGQAIITAPLVGATGQYTVAASKEGYLPPDSVTITVLNVPKLTIILPSAKVYGTKDFTVTVADDGGSAVIGAKVTFNGADYYTGAGGSVTITAPDVKETSKDYTLTATFTGFEPATEKPLTIWKTQGGIPGFELVTLIAAIGVALILLRRRRN